MNTKDFLKDIGLDYYAKKLEAAYAKPEPHKNILNFFSKTSMRMDDPRSACYVHMRNLIRTYGKKTVQEALDYVIIADGE